MQVFRLVTLASTLLAVGTLSGCRAGGGLDLARPNPLLPSSTASAAEVLAEHNRNAEQIDSMQAKADLTVTIHDRTKRDSSHPLSGRLALEQPRNFKLELYHTAYTTVGDIGSNPTEYWFWIKDKKQALYYCDYDEAEVNPQAATFQPDWIKEAMGLRVISESEAAEITVTPGEPGTLVLTHQPHQAGGKKYVRVTIVDKATHLIREHQLRGPDRKTVLARAEVPEGYLRIPVAAEPGSTTKESVLIPKRLKLSWIQEGFDLDVTFRERDVRINPALTQSQRDQLFVEPVLGKGYSRINLAENNPATNRTTTIRESRPAPPSGIRLRAPAAIEDDRGAERNGNPLALGGEEPTIPSLSESVIDGRFPAAEEPDYLKPSSNSSWYPANGPGIIRN